jgi:hypothetical protein
VLSWAGGARSDGGSESGLDLLFEEDGSGVGFSVSTVVSRLR